MNLHDAVIRVDFGWIIHNVVNKKITWYQVLHEAIVYKRYLLIDLGFDVITDPLEVENAIKTAVKFECKYLLKKIKSNPQHVKLAWDYAKTIDNKHMLTFLGKHHHEDTSPHQKFMEAVYSGDTNVIDQILNELDKKQREEFLLDAIHYCIVSDNNQLLDFLVSKATITWTEVASLALKHKKLDCADYCNSKISKLTEALNALTQEYRKYHKI